MGEIPTRVRSLPPPPPPILATILNLDTYPDRRRIERLILTLWVALFVTDFLTPWGVAVGGLHALPVMLSLLHRRRRAPLIVASVSAALVLLGAVLGAHGDSILTMVMNRSVALFIIGITCVLTRLRRSAERELVAHGELVTTTLQSIADAVISTDAANHIAGMNAAAEELLGQRFAQARGRHLREVFTVPRNEEVAATSFARADKGPLRACETSVLRAGVEVPIEYSVALVRDADAQNLGAVLGRVIVFRDISERRSREAAVAKLAYRDTLTDLANRASFHDRLELELAHARRDSSRLALLFIDLDDFKPINDTLGHRAGDAVLVEIARRLRESLREADTVARWAGDEFTVILPKIASSEIALDVAAELLETIARPIDLSDVVDDPSREREVSISASIGVAMFPRDGHNVDSMVGRADGAMYAAKQAGGNCVDLASSAWAS